jgi:hypothetical protein
VYGAALIIIRLLEELNLEDNELSLIKVKNPKDIAFFTKTNKEGKVEKISRRGIENYIVEHPDCRQFNQWVSGSYVTKYWLGSFKNYPKAATAIQHYIKELMTCSLKKGFLNQSQEIGLNSLLKRMTLNDPNNRPTMNTALTEFEAIFEDYLQIK